MEQTVDILLGIRERYEQHHKVTITDEAVKAAADLSIRYITDRHLPDKAIDLIDEAASRVRLRHASAPPVPARGAEGAGARHQGEGRGDQQPGVRGSRDAARGGGDRQGEGRHAARRVAGHDLRRPADRRRGRDRPGRRDVDRHPGHAHLRAGVRAAAAHGGRPARPGHRPAGGDRDHRQGRPPRARRPQGSEAARSARSSSSARPASGRRSWPRPSPSSCSAARTRSSRST